MSRKPRNLPPQPQAPTPRQLPEIEAENEKLCAHAGKLQYQIFVLDRDLERTNEAIMNCNYEAAARQKLDAPEKKEA